jgi:hypothetical protein
MMKLLARLLDSVSTGKIKAEASTLVALLSSVLDTLTYFQRESAALELLDMAEASLSSSDTGETSPVPRSLYTKVISLLVAKRDVKTIEKLFDRMKSKYAGAVDLLPDKNAYNMFIFALSNEGGVDNLDKQESLLNELAGLYETTGDEAFKPLDRTFNQILSGMTKRSKDDATVVDRMNALLNRMVSLNVEVKDSYGFNMAMQIVMRNGKNDTFPAVMEILKRMEDAGVESNEYTLHNILTACGRAGPRDRENALSTLTGTLGKIRALGLVEAKTYPWALRSLSRTISQEDPRAGKLAEALFQLCCQDGFLNPQTKDQLQELVGKVSWDRLYSRHLRKGDIEPEDWSVASRNL